MRSRICGGLERKGRGLRNVEGSQGLLVVVERRKRRWIRCSYGGVPCKGVGRLQSRSYTFVLGR